jgi:hypothetical protein
VTLGALAQSRERMRDFRGVVSEKRKEALWF